MAKIIIDLDKVNSPSSYADKDEVFQHEAFRSIDSVFKKLLNFKNDDNEAIHKMRRHDTIFIDGARGSGKTAFLLNIENQLNSEFKKECKFFNPIDPTLLEHSENFLGVILGLIVKEIENSVATSSLNDSSMKEYYNSLEKLSKSLGAVKTLSESIGIDEIADFRSSNALEDDAHNFFYAVTKLFKVKVLVLLIDDIDMAFKKGFDVLETVRKKLASPYIIPVVSGDGKLYKKLIRNHFEREISCSDKCIEIDEYNPNKELINQSVDQYFNKVMPNDNRIDLKDIFTVLKENEVFLQIDEKKIPYTELKDFEIRLINYGINQVQFTKNIFKNNTRSFVQYLAKKREIFEIIEFPNKDEKDYRKYQIRDDIDSVIQTLTDDTYQKSLTLTQNFYHFSSDYDKQQLSKMLKNDIQAFRDNQINSYQIFLGDFFQNEQNRNKKDKKENYLKLEKEVINDKLFIVKDGLVNYLKDKNKNSTLEYIIPRLFTHDDYYSSSSSTRFHFFTGKFIEFMMFSISHDFEDNKKSIEIINKIINNKPYNMNFYSNNYLEEVDNEITDSEHTYPKEIKSEKFLGELKNWHKELKGHYTTTIQLHGILNKFFNNINVLKGESLVKEDIKNKINKQGGLNTSRLIENNNPWQIFQRVVIIFINAVASIEKKGIISNSNIATSLGSFSLKNVENSQTYRDNIKTLKENKESFISILLKHPIIHLILSENINSFKFEFKEKTYIEIRDSYFTTITEINPVNALAFHAEISKNLDYFKEYNAKAKRNKLEQEISKNLKLNEL